MAAIDDISPGIAALGDLPREELAGIWRKSFGCDPPKGVHKTLLIRAAAFDLQQKHRGGLSGDARRLLKTAMQDAAKTIVARCGNGPIVLKELETSSQSLKPEQQKIRSGTRLIREWNGKSYVVDVVEDGFIYAGGQYRSLSKIAREITGTNWSGPRFFGL